MRRKRVIVDSSSPPRSESARSFISGVPRTKLKPEQISLLCAKATDIPATGWNSEHWHTLADPRHEIPAMDLPRVGKGRGRYVHLSVVSEGGYFPIDHDWFVGDPETAARILAGAGFEEAAAFVLAEPNSVRGVGINHQSAAVALAAGHRGVITMTPLGA